MSGGLILDTIVSDTFLFVMLTGYGIQELVALYFNTKLYNSTTKAILMTRCSLRLDCDRGDVKVASVAPVMRLVCIIVWLQNLAWCLLEQMGSFRVNVEQFGPLNKPEDQVNKSLPKDRGTYSAKCVTTRFVQGPNPAEICRVWPAKKGNLFNVPEFGGAKLHSHDGGAEDLIRSCIPAQHAVSNLVGEGTCLALGLNNCVRPTLRSTR